jgi:hypothetical protein
MDLNPHAKLIADRDVELLLQLCSARWLLPDNSLDVVFTLGDHPKPAIHDRYLSRTNAVVPFASPDDAFDSLIASCRGTDRKLIVKLMYFVFGAEFLESPWVNGQA